MSEQMKFIVDKLNAEPFNRKFNLISFDALDSLQLQQILNDVLGEIDPQHKLDLRDEAPEDTAIRMFSCLRVLKYKPKTEQGSLQAFRVGLVKGEKHIIHPVLHWLLQRIPDLKKRAYLARFLVKIDVPQDMLLDDQVQMVFSSYEDLLEQFKEAHKATERIKSSGVTATEVRADIVNMEDERQQVRKRIERLKKKVQTNVPNPEAALKAATAHRKEKEHEHQLGEQKVDQKNQLLHLEQRYQRVRKQLRDLQASNMGSSAEGLIQQLEDENSGNSFIVKEKLPRELLARRQVRDSLRRISDEPTMSQDDIAALQEKVQQTNEACRQLYEQRIVNKKPVDDKVSLFRQQAAVVGRKKEGVASSLAELRDEVAQLEAEVAEKRSRLDGVDEQMLNPDGAKDFLKSSKRDHDLLKVKKREMEAVQAENGIKERSLDLVIQQGDAIKQEAIALEEQHGVGGFQNTQENLAEVAAKKSGIDETKERLLEDLSAMVLKLDKISKEKSTTLQPLIKEIRPLRMDSKTLEEEHAALKQKYDVEKAGLESESSVVEQDVRSLHGSLMQQETRLQYLKECEKCVQAKLERAAAEFKLYTSGTKDKGEKKQTFRESHQKRMQALDATNKELKQKQKEVRANHAENMKQMKMWQDVQQLMVAKRAAFKKQEERRQEEAEREREILANEDRLVI